MRVFAFATVVALVPGAAYTLWLIRTMRKSSLRWLQNDATIGVFWVASFPAMLGVLASAVRTDLFSSGHLVLGPVTLVSSVVVLLTLLLFYLLPNEQSSKQDVAPPYLYEPKVAAVLDSVHQTHLVRIAGEDAKEVRESWKTAYETSCHSEAPTSGSPLARPRLCFSWC
jgi:hypothetical protein